MLGLVWVMRGWDYIQFIEPEKLLGALANALIAPTEMGSVMIAEIAGLAVDGVVRLLGEGKH